MLVEETLHQSHFALVTLYIGQFAWVTLKIGHFTIHIGHTLHRSHFTSVTLYIGHTFQAPDKRPLQPIFPDFAMKVEFN